MPNGWRAEVDGELTIRGVTRAITARGDYVAPRLASFGETAGLQLQPSFDRREFGFDWQVELSGGGQAVGWGSTQHRLVGRTAGERSLPA